MHPMSDNEDEVRGDDAVNGEAEQEPVSPLAEEANGKDAEEPMVERNDTPAPGEKEAMETDRENGRDEGRRSRSRDGRSPSQDSRRSPREKSRERSPRDASPRDASPRDRSPRDRSPRDKSLRDRSQERSPRDRSPRRRSRSPRDRSRSRDRAVRRYSRSRSRVRGDTRRRSRSRGSLRERSRDRNADRYDRDRYARRRSRSPVPPPRRYSPRSRPPPPATGLHLFVAGVNFIVNERDLERKFGKYGKVRDARIVRNPRTGESRGFGFVVMDHDDDVDRAVRHMDGREWNGRRLLVERARNIK